MNVKILVIKIKMINSAFKIKTIYIIVVFVLLNIVSIFVVTIKEKLSGD